IAATGYNHRYNPVCTLSDLLHSCGTHTLTVERSISNRHCIPHAISVSRLLRRAAAISAARVRSSSATSKHRIQKGRASIQGSVEPYLNVAQYLFSDPRTAAATYSFSIRLRVSLSNAESKFAC